MKCEDEPLLAKRFRYERRIANTIYHLVSYISIYIHIITDLDVLYYEL